MRKINYLLYLSLLLLSSSFLFTSCIEGDLIDETPVNSFTSTRRIAVFAPAEDTVRLKKIASWVSENINSAQLGQKTQIDIQLEWYDESDERQLEYDYEAALTDKSVCAIIGPMESVHAKTVCEMASRYQSRNSESVIKPIVLPTVTSTELQRVSSECKYLWCLSENDVTQSKVLVTLASQMAAKSTDKNVCLIYSDDIYGQSFRDWVPFICSELGINFGTQMAINASGADNTEEIKIAMNEMGDDSQIIIASSDKHDYIACDSLLSCGALSTKRPESIQLIASDQALNSTGISKYHRMWGVTPAPKPSGGFLQAYRSRMGQELMDGDSEMYDAVLFLFYGLYLEAMDSQNTSSGTTIYDALCRVVDGDGTPNCSWTTSGIKTAISAYVNNQTLSVNGCTNDWAFSNKVRTAVTNSYYLLWNCVNQSLNYVTYLTSDKSGKTTSINDAWSWYGLPDTESASSGEEKEYPELGQKWALLVAGSSAFASKGSTTFAYYRHQADVLWMYQVLKRHGYDDDHIVLIMEDDIAQSQYNPNKGDVHCSVGGENVRKDADVDYKLSDLDNLTYATGGSISYNAIPDILTGNTLGGKLGKVLRPNANDDILIYWCGHADDEGQLCWLDDKVPAALPSFWLDDLQSHGFRKVLVLLETCFSGKIGESIDIPGVLTITAANANEESYADEIERDPNLGGIYLSDGFSNTLIRTLDETPDISLFDLYLKLAANTCGSHVKVYGAKGYGSLYNSSMLDYLEKK